MEAKTKRSITIWVVVVLVILNISSLATIWYHRYQFRQQRLAQVERRFDGRNEVMNRRRSQMPPFITEALELSPEQKNTLDSIWSHFNFKRQLLEDSMEQNRRQMFRFMMAANLDTGKYEELSENQTRMLRELNYTLLEMNRTIRANLTEDQQNTMIEKMEKMQQRATRERRHRLRK